MHTMFSMDNGSGFITMTEKGYNKVKKKLGVHLPNRVGPFVLIKSDMGLEGLMNIKAKLIQLGFEHNDELQKNYFVEYCDTFDEWGDVLKSNGSKKEDFLIGLIFIPIAFLSYAVGFFRRK